MTPVLKAFIASIAILALLVPAAAQQAPAQKPVAKAVQEYIVKDEVRLQGKVEQVKKYDCPVSGTVGTHLVFSAEGKKYEVHLGPAKFLEEYGINLKEGDSIVLVGVKVDMNQEPAMLARQIERENDVFFFRDKKGRPLWR